MHAAFAELRDNPARRMVAGVFAAITIGLLGFVVAIPAQLAVDGHEYLSTVGSLLHSGSMKYEPKDMEVAAGLISPETSFVHGEVGQNTKRNRWGERVWGSHSFYVSLLALPFVALMAVKGFLVLNVLFFMSMLAAVYRSLRQFNDRGPSLALACVLLFLSPLPSYIVFVNSELMLMAALIWAVYFGLRCQAVPCALLLAVATAIKPPLVIVFVPLAIWHYAQKRDWRTVALMGAIFAAAGAPQLAYYLYNFGYYIAIDLSPERVALMEEGRKSAVTSLAPIERVFRYMDPYRLRVFFASPDLGMLWYFPAAVWCVVRSGRPMWFTAMWLLTALGVALLTLYHPLMYTIDGGIRYATLVYPLLLLLPGRWRNSTLDYATMVFIAFFGAPLLMDATHANRHPQQLYGKSFPSMTIAQRAGVPIFPQTAFHAGRRYTRDLVFDFVDNEQFIRSARMQMMIRNAEPGEVIVKLLTPEDYPESDVRACVYRGGCDTVTLSRGRVSTLRIPVRAQDLVRPPYPEYFSRIYEGLSPLSPTAQIMFDVSEMGLRSGRGDLRWQRRFHESGRPFLYPVGPRVLAVYPSMDWILQTWASDALDPAFGEELGTRFRTSADGVFLHRQPEMGIEGLGGLVVENNNQTEPVVEIIATGRAPLASAMRLYGAIEVTGWIAASEVASLPGTSESPSRVELFVRWYDEGGEPVSDSPVWTFEQADNTRYRRELVEIPANADSMTLGVRFLHARGGLFIDDLVASWFKDVWDLRRHNPLRHE